MPRYAYVCQSCKHHFDELHTSFGAAERAENEGIPCPKCSKKKTKRNDDPHESMAGGAFRKYGLWTYGGAGN